MSDSGKNPEGTVPAGRGGDGDAGREPTAATPETAPETGSGTGSDSGPALPDASGDDPAATPPPADEPPDEPADPAADAGDDRAEPSATTDDPPAETTAAPASTTAGAASETDAPAEDDEPAGQSAKPTRPGSTSEADKPVEGDGPAGTADESAGDATEPTRAESASDAEKADETTGDAGGADSEGAEPADATRAESVVKGAAGADEADETSTAGADKADATRAEPIVDDAGATRVEATADDAETDDATRAESTVADATRAERVVTDADVAEAAAAEADATQADATRAEPVVADAGATRVENDADADDATRAERVVPDATRVDRVVGDDDLAAAGAVAAAGPEAGAAGAVPGGPDDPAATARIGNDGTTGPDDDATSALNTEDGAGSGAAPPPDVPPDGSSPGSGDSGKIDKDKPKRSRRVRYLRRALFTLLGLVGLVVAAFGVAYFLTPVPSPQEAAIAQGPTFYYSDGKTVIAKTGVNRDAVTMDQIPKSMRDAVIAAENRSFYDDPGISFSGTVRAFWSTATGEQLQGGSTITQQMVRNYYGGIGKERSVTRKLKEIMVSLKVGREKPKDWILEQYLNTIFFGRDAYGVQAAAHAYYGKDVKDLTAAESAYLAAAIQQPSNFADPTGQNRVYAEQRWRAVLNNMVRDKAMDANEAAAMKFPAPAKQKITDILKGQKGYMVNVAKKELTERRGYSEDEINRSGLKIVTTYDKRLMDQLKATVKANTPAGMNKKIRTAVVSVDPKTGQVVAFYGGRNYLDEPFSSAFSDWAQVGSGFKPIALAAALDAGKSLTTAYDGSSPQTFNGVSLHNDSNENFGMVNLVTATEHSINTAYINLAQDIGNKKVAAMAEKMGIPAGRMTPAQRASASFPLGVISEHPVEQAGVYATFASEGVHRTPYVVKSVSDNDGKTRTFTEKGTRAFSAQVARDATYAMEQVVNGGTGTGAQLPDRDVAGKTGTTDAGAAIWFNGYIPQMATTVAMFRSDGKPLNIPGYGSYGGQLPAQIWSSYMREAVDIKGYEPKDFGEPSVRTGGYDSGGGQNQGTPGGPRTNRPGGPDTRGPISPVEPSGPTRPTGGPVTPPGSGGGNGDGGDGGGNGGGGGGTNPGGGGGNGPGGGGGGVGPELGR